MSLKPEWRHRKKDLRKIVSVASPALLRYEDRQLVGMHRSKLQVEVNPLPDNKILDWSKLTQIADLANKHHIG